MEHCFHSSSAHKIQTILGRRVLCETVGAAALQPDASRSHGEFLRFIDVKTSWKIFNFLDVSELIWYFIQVSNPGQKSFFFFSSLSSLLETFQMIIRGGVDLIAAVVLNCFSIVANQSSKEKSLTRLHFDQIKL